MAAAGRVEVKQIDGIIRHLPLVCRAGIRGLTLEFEDQDGAVRDQ